MAVELRLRTLVEGLDAPLLLVFAETTIHGVASRLFAAGDDE
jgi:hypothetical protein